MSDPAIPDPKAEEPAMKAGGITAVAGAVVWLLVEFGADLTAKQQAALLGAIVVLFPLAQAAWTRRKVFSPATVARLLRGRED